jgi:hypothetical protein
MCGGSSSILILPARMLKFLEIQLPLFAAYKKNHLQIPLIEFIAVQHMELPYFFPTKTNYLKINFVFIFVLKNSNFKSSST